MVIEDKSIGLKIAEDPQEAFWSQFKDKCQKDILNSEREIIIANNLIKLSDEQLKKWKK